MGGRRIGSVPSDKDHKEKKNDCVPVEGNKVDKIRRGKATGDGVCFNPLHENSPRGTLFTGTKSQDQVESQQKTKEKSTNALDEDISMREPFANVDWPNTANKIMSETERKREATDGKELTDT